MPLASIIVSQTWKLRCSSNIPVFPGPDYIRGLFGKFVEFGYKMFKYLYNPFIF